MVADARNVTAQALEASQANTETAPAENAVQRDAGASNEVQPTGAPAVKPDASISPGDVAPGGAGARP